MSTTAEQPTATRPGRAPWIAAGLVGAVVAVLLLLERTGTASERGLVLTGASAWSAAGLVVLAAVGLLAAGVRSPRRWRYPDAAPRDQRLDLLRGIAIVFVVLNHLDLPSLFQLASQEAVGPVSGAELFVALSGVVVGMVYRVRLARGDLAEVTGLLWRRALTLYRAGLVVVLLVYLLTLLPGVDGRAVTTFSDGGAVSDLYPNAERLGDYPVPGWLVRDLLLLELGPFQVNVLGLYVVLLLVAPLLLAALRRGLVLPVLAVSAGLYAVNAVQPTRLLTSQFEDPFPLLTWQLLFVVGLVVGWYRTELLARAGRPSGRAVVALVVLAHVALLLLAASSPYLSNGYDVRLALLPAADFDALYADWFVRRTLGLGRLLDTWLLLGALYGLMTAFWGPLSRAVGWFFVPLGAASLYVFVLHVFAALVVANVPGLDGGSIALGTLAHAVVLGALWAAVRRRFLFRLVPH